ncbi:MAG: hypothetical protein OXC07_04135 [Kistimonas sp.]|nr:hypothetical protein [Kistimonas sp.]
MVVGNSQPSPAMSPGECRPGMVLPGMRRHHQRTDYPENRMHPIRLWCRQAGAVVGNRAPMLPGKGGMGRASAGTTGLPVFQGGEVVSGTPD